MNMKYLGAVILSVVLIAGLAGCAQRRTEPPGDKTSAKELFEEKCSFCHGLNVALEENHTLAGWRGLVHKEAGRRIWFISSAEQEVIARYLFRISPADEEKPPRKAEPGEEAHDNPENVRAN